MNIVYLLTNTSKTEGKRFYVGSKQECQVMDVEGIPTMIGRDGKPYYSSSASFELREDVKNGGVLSAEVLENVPDKSKLLDRENHWIQKLNAVESDEFYNIANAYLNCHNQDAIANLYGETVRDLASNNSSVGKRDNGAKELGFSNFGEMCFSLWEDFKICQNWATIADKYKKQRHWAKTVLCKYDMEKAKLDLDGGDSEAVRQLISKKCSLFKAAEILGLEIPAVRVLLGDFNKSKERAYSVALLSGYSRGELEANITRDILDGMGFDEACVKYKINATSVRRYFMRCIRRHLTSADISDVIPETEEEIASAKIARKDRQTRISTFVRKDVSLTQSNNSSGVTGVWKDSSSTAWVASYKKNLKNKTKSWSIAKYGNDEAFRLACEYRKMWELSDSGIEQTKPERNK